MFRRHTAAQARAGLPPCASSVLSIRSARDGDRHVVAPAGALDLATAPQFARELTRVESTDARRIVVDLRALELIDSVGMTVLIGASARSRSHGNRLRIVRGPENVHRPFELCGLASRLPFVDAEDTVPGV